MMRKKQHPLTDSDLDAVLKNLNKNIKLQNKLLETFLAEIEKDINAK
jgi:hypothetical protein